MKKFLSIIIIFHFFSFKCTNLKEGSASEASQFDFWAGDWVATWYDIIHPSNKILKITGGCLRNGKFNNPSQNYTRLQPDLL